MHVRRRRKLAVRLGLRAAVVALSASFAGSIACRAHDQELAPAPAAPPVADIAWRAWGPEAFDEARRTGRPIFLSLDFSTCHWCRVMDRESFQSAAIASRLEASFVPVKADREERPDLAELYLISARALSKTGAGWPVSVFLEPTTLAPFYGGGYFPPEELGRLPGFERLLESLNDQWANDRETLLDRARLIASEVERSIATAPAEAPLTRALVDRAIAQLMTTYDPINGGFGRRPKIAQPWRLELLMHVGWQDVATRAALLHTLDRLAIGGLYDHLAGGFHRAASDHAWLVPNFDKTLCDNGQLASVYAEAYERTEDMFYGRRARETLDWIVQEMLREDGRLAIAQDGEVDGELGRSYVWTAEEVQGILERAGLTAGEVQLAMDVYGLDEEPTFRASPSAEARHVLHLSDRPDHIAESLDREVAVLERELAAVCPALLAARRERMQPVTDERSITAWSGLAIAGLAEGGRVLGEAQYVEAAARAADFVLGRMRGADGSLMRWIGAEDAAARGRGFLEDYAFMIRGLLALHRATADPARLEQAAALARTARSLFLDESAGGYYGAPAGTELFARPKPIWDGGLPTSTGLLPGANGAMALVLIELHERTGDESFLDDAIQTLRYLSGPLDSSPMGAALATLALARLLEEHPERLPAAPMGPPRPAEEGSEEAPGEAPEEAPE